MSDLISRKDAIDAVDNFSMAVIEEMRITARTTVTACMGERYTMTKAEVKDLLNALPPAEKGEKVIREHARLVLEGVAKMCNERRNLLEFKCEGCSFLDWCVDISDSVTYEPWEWLAIEGVMEID